MSCAGRISLQADVEANFLIVKAYEYTTITSVTLLDCFTVPCVVVLSAAALGKSITSTRQFFRDLPNSLCWIRQWTAGFIFCPNTQTVRSALGGALSCTLARNVIARLN